MSHAPTWYNAERVRQPGSVVLARWNAERAAQRAGHHAGGIRAQNDVLTGLTIDQLAERLGALATSYSGKAVTENTARQVSAVYACVDLIAGAVASLPLPIYERTASGRREVTHDYYWILNESASDDLSADAFWTYIIESQLFHGDGFAEILRPSLTSNRMIGLRPHHPANVQPYRRSEDGALRYRITPDARLDGTTTSAYTLDPADMLHFTGSGFDGLRSVSPITYAARQAIGTAMAAEEFSGRFFATGARPDIVLESESKIDPDQVKLLRSTWTQRYGGSEGAASGPVVLSGGLKMKQFSLSAEDSQLIATRGFQIEDITRFFGVPPHMIGHTDKTTAWGAGVENMGRGFVKFALRRRLNKIEQELNRKLWPTRARYFTRFNVADLERGDLKSENEALRIAIGRAGEPGWMTQDEVRLIKNLPPKGGAADQLTARDTATAAAQGTPDPDTEPAPGEPA